MKFENRRKKIVPPFRGMNDSFQLLELSSKNIVFLYLRGLASNKVELGLGL